MYGDEEAMEIIRLMYAYNNGNKTREMVLRIAQWHRVVCPEVTIVEYGPREDGHGGLNVFYRRRCIAGYGY